MTTTETPMPDQEIEELLPWYASGSLPARDRARIEAALAANPALRHSLALIGDDRAAAIAANEALGAPSPKAFDRLFAAIDREPAPKVRLVDQARGGIVNWLGELLSALRPRQLAYGAVAVMALVVVQGATLTSLIVRDDAGMTDAMAPGSGARSLGPGLTLLVGFEGSVTADRLTQFLTERHARIIDGPSTGGLYRIEVGFGAVSRSDADSLIRDLRARTDVVRFVGMSQ
jgi:hypothetical protein